MRLYFDYAASTPVDPRVFEAMRPYFSEKFGNPGSLHTFGQEATAAVDKSREALAKFVGTDFRGIIFTSSATEANNLAIRGAIGASHVRNPRIIVSAIEHESVLEVAKDLGENGVEIVRLSVNREGLVDLRKLKETLNDRTVLVSIVCVNNEIGTVEPIVEISRIISGFRGSKPYPLFHSDAAQAFNFFGCQARELGVDLITLSAQKIYGPKGAGALCFRPTESNAPNLKPIIFGGGQEFGLRSGTENVAGIVGFTKAAELAVDIREAEFRRILSLKKRFWEGLKSLHKGVEINGPAVDSPHVSPHILNVYFPGHESDELLAKFDLKGVAASVGSACSAKLAKPSYVIEALGYGKERARGSIRFSLGRGTTEGQIDEALDIIKISL